MRMKDNKYRVCFPDLLFQLSDKLKGKIKYIFPVDRGEDAKFYIKNITLIIFLYVSIKTPDLYIILIQVLFKVFPHVSSEAVSVKPVFRIRSRWCINRFIIM